MKLIEICTGFPCDGQGITHGYLYIHMITYCNTLTAHYVCTIGTLPIKRAPAEDQRCVLRRTENAEPGTFLFSARETTLYYNIMCMHQSVYVIILFCFYLFFKCNTLFVCLFYCLCVSFCFLCRINVSFFFLSLLALKLKINLFSLGLVKAESICQVQKV